MQAEAGKGSAPRQQQNKAAYDEGWDRIFGRERAHKILDELVRINEELGLYEDTKPGGTNSPNRDTHQKATED